MIFLNDSSSKTTVSSVANFISDSHFLICSEYAFPKAIFLTFIIFPCPCAVYMYKIMILLNNSLASVAQLDAPSDWRPGGRWFNPLRGRQHSFMEIDHEIFSMVILSLLLIQEGQLSVSGKRMCTILVNHLED